MNSETASTVFIFFITMIFTLFVSSAVGTPTESEIETCKDEAQSLGVQYKDTVKERRISCSFKCKFGDGSTKVLMTPSDTLCCDVGILPTGRCDGNGNCPAGTL